MGWPKVKKKNGNLKERGYTILEFAKERGFQMFMLPVVWSGYFLESPVKILAI